MLPTYNDNVKDLIMDWFITLDIARNPGIKTGGVEIPKIQAQAMEYWDTSPLKARNAKIMEKENAPDPQDQMNHKN